MNAAREDENEIIIFDTNFRMNQRWRFIFLKEKEKEGKENNQSSTVHIMSALTSQFVVYSKDMDGLMQASYPEEWTVESTEIKEYVYIKHAKKREYLCYDTTLNKIYFSQTKLSKWYIQNRQYSEKEWAVHRTFTI